MNYDLVSDKNLIKLYQKVDRLINRIKKEAGIKNASDEITSIEELNLRKSRDPNVNLRNTFKYYLNEDLDLFKIFFMLLFSPQGLTKYELTLYLKGDCYKNLPLAKQIDKIKKNENYTEKGIAHLSALLYMFFPEKRDDLEIVIKKENTQAGAYRYYFKKCLKD